MSAERTIVLQVGDRRFTTHKETLTGGSGYFSSKFSGRWGLEPQEDGSYFLDGEPEVFDHVLRYLRHGIYPLLYDRVQGFDFPMYLRVLKQAEYLVIPKLMEWIKDKKFLLAIKTSHSTNLYEAGNGKSVPNTTANANVSVSYRASWQTVKVFICPIGNPTHRGDKKKCERWHMFAQGNDGDQFEEELVCKVMQVIEKTTFDYQVCMDE